MKRIAAAVLCLLASTPTQADENTIVLGISDQHRVNVGRTVPFQRQWCSPHFDVCTLQLSSRPTDATLHALESLPGVRYAERDVEWKQAAPPGDERGTPDCWNQWELDTIGATSAWNFARGARAPWIAILDGGFRSSHEELSIHIAGQHDYADGDDIAEVVTGGVPSHGTFIAGLIGGVGNNSVGRAGIAPEGRLFLAKIADSQGRLFTSTAIRALSELLSDARQVRVINYSIGGPDESEGMRDALSAIRERILFITVAGNCNNANCVEANNDAHPFYPGSFGFDHVVTVSSSTPGNDFNAWSHYGMQSVDLAAPGIELCSSGVGSDSFYEMAGGTSYAAPLVAGTAALIFERHPSLKPYEASRILRATARKSNAWSNRVRSGGVLDSAAAVQMPFPRLSAPTTRGLTTGVTELSLRVINAAAAGELCVVVTHPPAVEARAAVFANGCMTRTGSPRSLPDGALLPPAGTEVTLFCSDIAEHSSGTVRVELHHQEVGQVKISARAIMLDSQGHYLNAPFVTAPRDLTDRGTYERNVSGTEVSTSLGAHLEACRRLDTPADGVSADSEVEAAASNAKAPSCSSGPMPGVFPLLLPILLAVWRRRT